MSPVGGLVAAGCLAASAALLVPAMPPSTRRRAQALGGSETPGSVRFVLACATGVGVALLLTGPTGLVLGAAAGVLAWRSVTREPVASARRREARQAWLPLMVTLLAAAHRAGCDHRRALAVVGPACARGGLEVDLRAVADRLDAGATAAEAWAVAPVDLAPVASAVARSSDSGAALADVLDACARDVRTRATTHSMGRARGLGVLLAAPLGLCFLPGFLLLGVVPVVVGLVRATW